MNTAYMNTSVHLCRYVVSVILDECIGVKFLSDIVTLCLTLHETVKESNISSLTRNNESSNYFVSFPLLGIVSFLFFFFFNCLHKFLVVSHCTITLYFSDY